MFCNTNNCLVTVTLYSQQLKILLTCKCQNLFFSPKKSTKVKYETKKYIQIHENLNNTGLWQTMSNTGWTYNKSEMLQFDTLYQK